MQVYTRKLISYRHDLSPSDDTSRERERQGSRTEDALSEGTASPPKYQQVQVANTATTRMTLVDKWTLHDWSVYERPDLDAGDTAKRNYVLYKYGAKRLILSH